MLEYETFTYLDVQKTGSTFICYLLQHFCSEKEMNFRKHGNVARHDPNKFYFISVRDPLDQYMSLYSHGCGGKGNLYHKLRKQGVDDLYNSSNRGFRRWLRFVLDPKNAALLDATYGSTELLPNLIGFQTYRYLELAMRESTETLAGCQTQDDIRKAYNEKKIVDDTVRNERLNADLERLIKGRLRSSFSDAKAALKFVKEGPRLNASDRIDKFMEDDLVGKKGKKLVREREWLLHELFGY
jgi:hypothetical protein